MSKSGVDNENSSSKSKFEVVGWDYLAVENALKFCFVSDKHGEFFETVEFPASVNLEKHIGKTEFNNLLDFSAFFLGISYYKASLESCIVSDLNVTTDGLKCISSLYTSGLGEFYARNQLDYPPNLEFMVPTLSGDWNPVNDKSSGMVDEANPVVAFGGGKDSHAAIELLTRAGKSPHLVSVVLSEKTQNKLSSMCEREISFVKRRIDPKLIDLNKTGSVYNGHIPITGLNSILLVIYAYCLNRKWVVFSNERGASDYTNIYMGSEVNHQHSKSLGFEGLFRKSVYSLMGDKLQYFSLLRSFSELWVAAFVAKEVKSAHRVFASCNRNFIFSRQDNSLQDQRWCGECSKCIYTAIIFAPNLPVAGFLNLFEKDILDDEKNLQTALELCGLQGDKPWECVGETGATAAALHYLSNESEWKQKCIPKIIGSILDEHQDYSESERKYFSELDSRGTDFLPTSLKQITAKP